MDVKKSVPGPVAETRSNVQKPKSKTALKIKEMKENYATLTVTKQTGEAVVYKDFDFADQDIDERGWTNKVAEGIEATGELKQGAFVFDIVNPGTG